MCRAGLLGGCGAVLAIVRRRDDSGVLSSCRGDSGSDAADATLTVVGHRRWRSRLPRSAVDLYYGAGVAAASGYALANSVEPVVGASLVLAWCKGVPDLRMRR